MPRIGSKPPTMPKKPSKPATPKRKPTTPKKDEGWKPGTGGGRRKPVE